MSREETSSIGTSLIVFLLGVAVGATVAVLYAPSSGSETRAKLAEAAEKLKERTNELTQQIAEKAKEIREKVKPAPEAEQTAGAEAVAQPTPEA